MNNSESLFLDTLIMYKILVHCEIILEHEIASFYVTKNDDKDFSKLEFDLKIPCMYVYTR